MKAKKYMGWIAALGNEQGAGCACGCGRSPCQVAHVKYGEPCPGCDGEGHHLMMSEFPVPCRDCHVPGKYGGYSSRVRYGKKHGLRLDCWSLPLFHECHLMHEGAQHEHNERDWWREKKIDPLALCHRLQGIYDSNPLPKAIELGTLAIQEVRR